MEPEKQSSYFQFLLWKEGEIIHQIIFKVIILHYPPFFLLTGMYSLLASTSFPYQLKLHSRLVKEDFNPPQMNCVHLHPLSPVFFFFGKSLFKRIHHNARAMNPHVFNEGDSMSQHNVFLSDPNITHRAVSFNSLTDITERLGLEGTFTII